MREFDRITVGGVLVASLSVFGRNWVTFLPLSLIAFALFWIAFFIASAFGLDFDFTVRNAEMACGAWLGGGLAYGVVNTLRGTYASHWEVVRVAVKSMPMLLTVWIVQVLIVMAGLVLLIVPGCVFMAALSVALPAAVMERVGLLQALSRSWQLTRGWRWEMFGLQAIMLVVWVIVNVLTCSATGVCV